MALVSFGFWQSRMEGSPEAVGRTIYLDATPYSVVGIMPPSFRDYLGTRTDYWTPYASEQVREFERENGHELFGRLKPWTTLEASLRELQVIAESMNVEGWGKNGRRFGMRRLKDEVVGDSAYALELMFAAVAVVLAIACANLAQLLLARSDRRVSEFATRKALGAPAARLFRLALLESMLLSAAGGIGGVVLAYWLLPAMLALAPSEIPRITEAAIDSRVLTVAVGLTLLTGCAFGLAPSLRLSQLSVAQAMKRGKGIARRPGQFRSALVVGQVGCSVVLFVLAGLIGQTFLTLLPTDPGFSAASRTVRHLSLPSDYEAPERIRRWEELLERVKRLPGIVSAGLGTNVPFSGYDEFRYISAVDEGGDAAATLRIRADRRTISPNYFQVLQMPLARGRVFTSADSLKSPMVAIVNESLARKLAVDGEPLGRKVRISNEADSPVAEIVGVIADARSTGASTEIWDEIYISYAQNPAYYGYLIVRSELDPAALETMLRKEITAWEPALPDTPWVRATAMGDLVNKSLAGPRFSATLITAFSANALLLAAIGLFGLVAYSVSQRWQELGIRAALGARPGHLAKTAMRSAVVLTVVGIALGLATAVYLTRFVESQIHGVEPLDAATFAAAAAVMVVVAAAASYIPARRAARVDPMAALRYE